MKLNGLGTTASQLATWARMDLAGCGAENGGVANRLGRVLAVRWPPKLIGSAGSRTVLPTTRNWRKAEVPRWMPSWARRVSVPCLKVGELVKMSTMVPPPTLKTALEMRGLVATSMTPWIAPRDWPEK